MKRILAVAFALCALLTAPALAVPVRATTVNGAARDGKLVDVSSEAVHVEVAGGKIVKFPLAEIVGLDIAETELDLPPVPPKERKLRTERAVSILLAGGDRLVGALMDGDEESIELVSPLLGSVRVPLDAVRDIRFDLGGELAKLSRHTGDRDSISFREGDALTGWLGTFSYDALRIDCIMSDDYRVPYSSIAAIHLHPDEVPAPKGLVVQVTLADGGRVTGRAPKLIDDRLQLSPTLAEVAGKKVVWSVPLAAVRHLTTLGGAFVHLSDMKGLDVKVVPFFPPADPMLDPDEWLAPRRDLSFLGKPMVLGGHVMHKGLGAVSGTTIKVKLGGAYHRFRALVGVDDLAGARGSVTFEVLVDGRSRFKSEVLRAKGKPVSIPSVDLTGAKVLELRVGYGPSEGADVQDVANWGLPILVRKK